MHVDHRPRVAGVHHLQIVIVDAFEQHAAHHFKVARVIAVPDDADRIAVVEWHEDFRLGGGQAHVMLGKMSAASAEQATPDPPWRAPQHAGKPQRMQPRDTQIISVESRVGQASVSMCRSSWTTYHKKKTKKK